MKKLITLILIILALNCRSQLLTDTLKVDIDGKGQLENICFLIEKCNRIIISGGDFIIPIELGCGNTVAHLDSFDWVEYWKVVKKKETYQVYFKDNGDIDDTRPLMMQCDGIYVGQKEPSAGGIITYLDGKLSWIHQAD